jgi:hypothetical protein
MAVIGSLPNEVLLRVLFFVNAADLEAFASTCGRFSRISIDRMKQHMEWKKALRSAHVNSAEECQRLIVDVVFEDRGYYIQQLFFNDCQGFEYFDTSYKVDSSTYQEVLDISPHIPFGLKQTLSAYLSFPHKTQHPMLAILLLALPNLQHLTLVPGIFINRSFVSMLQWAAFKTSHPSYLMSKLKCVELLEWSPTVVPLPQHYAHPWLRYPGPRRQISLGIVFLFMSLNTMRQVSAFDVVETGSCAELLDFEQRKQEDEVVRPIQLGYEDRKRIQHREFPTVEHLYIQSESISASGLERVIEGMHGPRSTHLTMNLGQIKLLISPNVPLDS